VHSRKKLKLRLCRAVPSRHTEMDEIGDEISGLETGVSNFDDIATPSWVSE
jgi:hypothetical protein